jgi:SSS family solute:Na+ symporter
VARWSTLFWAVLIVLPAIAFTQSTGSILELLTKIGSYFVGAKLSMYALGFFSKHTTQRGLLIGVAAGFIAVGLTASFTDIAWPWYTIIGAGINMGVAIPASILLDGYQKEWSPFSVPGQRAKFKAEGKPEKIGKWHLVPGRLDMWSYYLIGFFVLTMLLMFFLQQLF